MSNQAASPGRAGLGIGVDVGGTTIKLAVVASDGTIVERSSLATDADRGPDAVLARIAEGLNPIVARHGDRVSGIGIGVPGVINAHGEIAYPPNFPGWEIVPVAERLAPLVATDLPIAVENDANIAAVAEARIGAASEASHFLYVTLGTGVGGAIIADGRIWRGADGGAGEIGHLSVDAFGRHCNCGSRGCIEAYLGQRYMSAIAAERLAAHPDSLVARLVAEGRSLDPQLLDEAALDGDPFATSLLAEMGELLGAALASALNLCDLHLVVIGGGISRAERTLIEPARRSLAARALKSISRDVELRIARFSGDAGIVGAALHGMEAAGRVASGEPVSRDAVSGNAGLGEAVVGDHAPDGATDI